MSAIQLDARKLLGFRLSNATSAAKVGTKTAPKIGAKIGNKVGGKPV